MLGLNALPMGTGPRQMILDHLHAMDVRDHRSACAAAGSNPRRHRSRRCRDRTRREWCTSWSLASVSTALLTLVVRAASLIWSFVALYACFAESPTEPSFTEVPLSCSSCARRAVLRMHGRRNTQRATDQTGERQRVTFCTLLFIVISLLRPRSYVPAVTIEVRGQATKEPYDPATNQSLISLASRCASCPSVRTLYRCVFSRASNRYCSARSNRSSWFRVEFTIQDSPLLPADWHAFRASPSCSSRSAPPERS